MAKFKELFESNKEIIEQMFAEKDLTHLINMRVLGNDRQKEIGKVIKANELTIYTTGVELFIIINEIIFDQLEEQQKIMVADEIISGITYNRERDSITINKPDITTHSGIIRKYTFDLYERLHETIKSLYEHKAVNDKDESENPTD